MSLLKTKVFFCIVTLFALIRAQAPEIIHSFDFTNANGWTFSDVNIAGWGDCPTGGQCWRLDGGGGFATATYSTFGYHNITVIIDLTTDLGTTEYCSMFYSPNGTAWTAYQTIISQVGIATPETFLNITNTLPPSVDNQNNFELHFENSGGHQQNDNCYWDNMYIWGIPYASSPTSMPITTKPTLMPVTIQPTGIPTQQPTPQTPSPTNIPTSGPTNVPTNNPTNPTEQPSSTPTTTPLEKQNVTGASSTSYLEPSDAVTIAISICSFIFIICLIIIIFVWRKRKKNKSHLNEKSKVEMQNKINHNDIIDQDENNIEQFVDLKADQTAGNTNMENIDDKHNNNDSSNELFLSKNTVKNDTNNINDVNDEAEIFLNLDKMNQKMINNENDYAIVYDVAIENTKTSLGFPDESESSDSGSLSFKKTQDKTNPNKNKDNVNQNDYKLWNEMDVYKWIISLKNGKYKKYDNKLKNELTQIQKIRGIHLDKIQKNDIYNLGIVQFDDKQYLFEQIQRLIHSYDNNQQYDNEGVVNNQQNNVVATAFL